MKFSDFEDADGRVDWAAYHKTKEDKGERCITCGSFIMFGAGFRTECRSCKGLKDDDGERDHRSLIRCPKCRESFDVVESELYELYAEGEHDIDCPKCDYEFQVVTSVSYSFCSPEMEE